MSKVRVGRVIRVAAALAIFSAAGCGKLPGGDGGGGKAPESPDGSPVLARVGNYVVTAKQVEERIKESSGRESLESNMTNPDIKQIALAAIIDQICFGKAAEDAGYAKDPQIDRAVYLYRTQLLATQYLADTIQKDATPAEEEIVEFYEKNKEHYHNPVRVALRHVMTHDRGRAEEAMKRLLAGDAFPKVARDMSEDATTKDLGGALGYVSEEEGVLGMGKDKAFLDAALALKQGETSPVFQSGAGNYHIVYCEEHQGGGLKSLDEVRDDIIRRIKNSGKLADAYNAALAAARDKYGAEVLQTELDSYLGTGDSAERLWEVVEMQPNDRGQLEVLRRIAFDFKKHDLADDAQLRMAYILAVKLGEPKRAEKAIQNLKSRFPNSDLMPAADWLQSHINDPTFEGLDTFDDLKAKATKG